MISLKKILCTIKPFFIIAVLMLLSIIFFRDSVHHYIPDNSINKDEVLPDNSSLSQFCRVPMSFEPNQGQVEDEVNFLSLGIGYTLYLSSEEAVLKLHNTLSNNRENLDQFRNNEKMIEKYSDYTVLRIKTMGSNPNPKIVGLDKLIGKSNYLIGREPHNWVTDVPNYTKVKYSNIYKGIDLVYYGNQQQLEYDFIVAPGTDPKIIKMHL